MIEYKAKEYKVHEHGKEYTVQKDNYDPSDEKWFYNGKLHRDYGPAVTYGCFAWVWFNHGLSHREDGPSYINQITNTTIQVYYKTKNQRKSFYDLLFYEEMKRDFK
jgi:hypothetical protein